jgi:hypothetical protein
VAPGRLRSSGSRDAGRLPLAGFVSALNIFTRGTAAAMGILFGAFFAISFAKRKADVTGTLTGHAPAVPAGARILTQRHRVRWESEGTRPRLV